MTGAAQHSYTVLNKQTLLFFMKLLLQICQEKKKAKRKKRGEQMKQELVDYNKILLIFIYFN